MFDLEPGACQSLLLSNTLVHWSQWILVVCAGSHFGIEPYTQNPSFRTKTYYSGKENIFLLMNLRFASPPANKGKYVSFSGYEHMQIFSWRTAVDHEL